MALGARAADVIGYTLTKGLPPLAWGLALGMALALALARLLEVLLYRGRGRPTDCMRLTPKNPSLQA